MKGNRPCSVINSPHPPQAVPLSPRKEGGSVRPSPRRSPLFSQREKGRGQGTKKREAPHGGAGLLVPAQGTGDGEGAPSLPPFIAGRGCGLLLEDGKIWDGSAPAKKRSSAPEDCLSGYSVVA